MNRTKSIVRATLYLFIVNEDFQGFVHDWAIRNASEKFGLTDNELREIRDIIQEKV